ncbi:MAG: polyprenyl synthetase family protein [Planctomycetota bacterium]
MSLHVDPKAAAEAEHWLKSARAWADEHLRSFLDTASLGPPEISLAVRYALQGGGKRIRPALVKLVAEGVRWAPEGSEEAADLDRTMGAAAVAIECVHTYSLVHDDLPCMDDDDLRRGRPTVHRAYDEASAVLAGDALLTLAFEWLAEHLPAEEAVMAIQRLGRAAGPAGMVGGQALDLASEGSAPDADLVGQIHSLKTARLLGAAAELGAIVGGANAPQRTSARRFGEAIGLTFQAIDDILDVTGDAATLGKTPGKDAASSKGTLVAALGLEGARGRAALYSDEARRLAGQAGLGSTASGIVDWLAARTS